MAVLACSSPAFAYLDGSAGNQGSTYSVAVDSPTYRLSTSLWTVASELGAESVMYQATSTADVYISTYAASTTTGGWKIVGNASPITIHNTSFRFALSSANVSVPLNVLICK